MSNDFRRGVGIFLLNSEKKLWVGKRLDYISDFWQMPQGGIDGEETPLEAMIRELGEEVGLKRNFQIVGSAHNIKEIKTKEIQGINKVFISSIFKKNKNYLGINKFKIISNLTGKKVVALGGISKKNINKLRLLKNFEFAGISYFE